MTPRQKIDRKVHAVDLGFTEGIQAASAMLVRRFGLSPKAQLWLMRWLLLMIALPFVFPAVAIDDKAGDRWELSILALVVLWVAVAVTAYIISCFVALLIIVEVDTFLTDGNLVLTSSKVGQEAWGRTFAAVATSVVSGLLVVAIDAPPLVGVAFAIAVLPSYLSMAIELFLTRKFLTDEPPPSWYSDAQST